MKSVKSFLTKIFFAAFIIISTASLLSAQEQLTSLFYTGSEEQIKFIGQEEEKLVFEVQLEQLPQKGASLSILDGQNNIIFQERIGTLSLYRRFKISVENIDKITFRISSKTFNYNQSFTINYRMEEKLEVKKVN